MTAKTEIPAKLAQPARPQSTRNAFKWVWLVALFIGTRLINFVLYLHPAARFVDRDVSYYGYDVYQLTEQGATDVMMEYPVPAVWILQGLYALGGGWDSWLPWFAGAMLLLDAGVAISLYRSTNLRGSLVWILFTGACGAIVWFRFDMLPAALVAWACVLLMSNPRFAGACVGVGAAIKLWPALLAFPMAAPDPRKPGSGRGRLLGFAVAGFGLAAASLLTAGWTRSASPVSWQSARGLQAESVPATPIMFLRSFTDRTDWEAFLSEYNAIELRGPGVGFLLEASTIATVGSLLLTAWLSWRLLRAFKSDSKQLEEAMLLVILTIVLATIVVNKTLSPQYITWLAGPVAVLAMRVRSGWLRRRVNIIVVAGITIALLTQYTYPWGTYAIMGQNTSAGFETSMLIARNLGLVLLFGFTTMLAVRSTSPKLTTPDTPTNEFS